MSIIPPLSESCSETVIQLLELKQQKRAKLSLLPYSTCLIKVAICPFERPTSRGAS